MKNRSVQAISIGLSAMSLVAPVGITAYAQEAEVSNDAETTTEQQVTSASEEKAIAEEVSNLSEQLNTTTTTDGLSEAASAPGAEGQFDQHVSDILDDSAAAKEAVGSVSASVDNVVKADEAIGEAQAQAQEAVNKVDDAVKSAGQATVDASDQADSAVTVLKDENTTEKDAAIIIADTDKTVEEAQIAFNEAEIKYNDAVAAYNNAKDDYDTALAAYNTNKASAAEGLEEAQTALECAQEHLETIQKQLESAQADLANAGADALVAAEDNKDVDPKTYLGAVIQYYYVPYSEELREGQSISNFQAVLTEADIYEVYYDVIDADGNVIRSVNADYGYTIVGDEGQVQLYTKEVVSQRPHAVNGAKGPSGGKGFNNYTKVVEKYVDLDGEVWVDLVNGYFTYISNARAKITAYENLLATVESAKTDFKVAQDKVASIKSQIADLNGATDIVSVAEMARLEILLKTAQEDYSTAKESLDTAKASLFDAKNIFKERFPKKVINSTQQTLVSENIIIQATEVENQVQVLEEAVDAELEEEIEELPEIEKTTKKATKKASNSAFDIAYSGASESSVDGAAGADSTEQVSPVSPEQFPTVPGEIVTIKEEETPLAITLAGLLQHGKWFAGLAGVSVAGAGVSIFEVKRRAAAKIIDKLNQ